MQVIPLTLTDDTAPDLMGTFEDRYTDDIYDNPILNPRCRLNRSFDDQIRCLEIEASTWEEVLHTLEQARLLINLNYILPLIKEGMPPNEDRFDDFGALIIHPFRGPVDKRVEVFIVTECIKGEDRTILVQVLVDPGNTMRIIPVLFRLGALTMEEFMSTTPTEAANFIPVTAPDLFKEVVDELSKVAPHYPKFFLDEFMNGKLFRFRVVTLQELMPILFTAQTIRRAARDDEIHPRREWETHYDFILDGETDSAESALGIHSSILTEIVRKVKETEGRDATALEMLCEVSAQQTYPLRPRGVFHELLQHALCLADQPRKEPCPNLIK